MKINIDVNESYKDLEVVVKTPKITNEVTSILEILKLQQQKNIIGNKNEKIYILNPKDILIFYTSSQKVLADTLENSFEIKMKLYEIEELLKDTSFVRISKFSIVNVTKIKNIELSFNGYLIVNLINGKQESISRRYTQKVKDFIKIGGY